MGEYKKSVTVNQMALRILNREDNLYKKEIVNDILNMYVEECKKALLNGERVQLSGLGTIIPEVKTHRSCFFPRCNNDTHENTPYARLKIKQTNLFKDAIDKQLLENIKNGIYGLEYTLFEKQQIANLKAGGFIQEDEETDYEEEE